MMRTTITIARLPTVPFPAEYTTEAEPETTPNVPEEQPVAEGHTAPKRTIAQIVRAKTEIPEEELLRITRGHEPEFTAIPRLVQKHYIKLGAPGEYGGICSGDSRESIMKLKESKLAATITKARPAATSPFNTNKKGFPMTKFLIISIALIIATACTQPEQEPSAEETPSAYAEIPENTITNLYDAFGEDKPGMQKDFGFSCLVNYNGTRILFDAGSNADIFKQNVEALQIDLKQIDFAIASHTHFDHINGFDYLLTVNPDIKIYFPFDMFWGANPPFNISGRDSAIVDSLDKKMQYFGGEFGNYKFNQTGRFWNANIEFIRGNMQIAPGIRLISTASPYTGYFSKYPGVNNHTEEQEARLVGLNELSLSLKTEDGEVVIAGCSHSTVEAIVTETKAYTDNNIALVYGGYHLLPYDRATLQAFTRSLQNELGVKSVAPAHCTGHLAFKILQDHYNERYLFAGLGHTLAF